MDGLAIWAHSYCRSTLAFFLNLGKQLDCDFKLFVRNPERSDLRTKVGFSNSEFNNQGIEFISDDFDKCNSLLLKHRTWNHIFGAYQNLPIYNYLINSAIKHDITYGIASEAPCNMSAPPKRYLKEIYLRSVLPYKLRRHIRNASFIINLSGANNRDLEKLGWSKDKIISCGYYPPPIPGSCPYLRKEEHWRNFTILLSGIHQWHRSPFVLIKALEILANKGLKFKCIITQDGPELHSMETFVNNHGLNQKVEFLGFVEMDELIRLYENCSVYVGAGNYEPWGMRLNDVLQCGAPLIVNEGMGGCLLVEKYNCGLTFMHNNPEDLANQLSSLIQNKNDYLRIAKNSYQAALEIAPSKMAPLIFKHIVKYPGWSI